jgi:hypothetical protein
MRTANYNIVEDRLDLDRESLISAHLLKRCQSEYIIHIRDSLPRAAYNYIAGRMRPVGHQLDIHGLVLFKLRLNYTAPWCFQSPVNLSI